MRRLLLILALCGVCYSQTTPNLHLNIPTRGAANWDVLLNANFNSIDSYLTGGTPLPSNLTIVGLFSAGSLVVTGSGSFGSLTVTGLTTTGTESVTGLATLGSLSVTGLGTLGSLTVTGASTLAGVSATTGTFSGALTASGGGSLTGTFSGAHTLSGAVTFTGSVTATVPITGPSFVSSSANPAASGIFRLANTDTTCWRNNANSADVCLSKNASDNLVFPNGLSLGGGTALATTNQTGTGNLVLATSPALVTPALNGVVISGTPVAGQTLTATSGIAASWASSGVTKDFSVTGCTTATSTDSSCTGNITIPVAFADNAYFPVLTINSVNGAFVAVSVSGTLAAGTIPYTVTCTFNCAAIVAPTIYVHAFHP